MYEKEFSNEHYSYQWHGNQQWEAKEQKDLSNMTKHVKKYQDKEPITERMTATAEKAREVKQWKSQSKTNRKNQSVSSIKTF